MIGGKRKRQWNALNMVRRISILVLLQCHGSCSSASLQVTAPDVTYWEEEVPEPIKDNGNDEDKPAKRRLFWQGRMNEEANSIQSQNIATASSEKKKTPHSMRTNEWRLDLKMSRKERSRLGIENQTHLLLDFSEESGHVRVLKNENTTLSIGTWTLHPSGITWQFPMRNDEDDTVVTLQCHGDLILNPFGSHARMVRGTIVKNSRKWFRPVVATFSAIGIGQDTVDVSYRDRGFGL